MAIKWGEQLKPSTKDQGHSAVQYGHGENRGYGMASTRSYVRCECGVRLSGQGDGGLDSYWKHKKRELKKIQENSQKL